MSHRAAKSSARVGAMARFDAPRLRSLLRIDSQYRLKSSFHNNDVCCCGLPSSWGPVVVVCLGSALSRHELVGVSYFVFPDLLFVFYSVDLNFGPAGCTRAYCSYLDGGCELGVENCANLPTAVEILRSHCIVPFAGFAVTMTMEERAERRTGGASLHRAWFMVCRIGLGSMMVEHNCS